MGEDMWLSLRQASDMTGKSINALRILVNRRRFDMVKRIENNGRSYLLVHRDSLMKTCTNDMGGTHPRQEHVERHGEVNTITLEAYEEKRSQWQKERDELQAGLMMYRYKFEEMERQMRLLPAPVEVVTSKLTELEHREEDLRTSRQAISDLEAELQKERSLNWWQKIWRK